MSSENSYIGRSLGNYCITSEIGSGGFGKVYQGQHTILTERKVAIKQLHSHLGSPEERDQFLEEARLLERLKCSQLITNRRGFNHSLSNWTSPPLRPSTERHPP